MSFAGDLGKFEKKFNTNLTLVLRKVTLGLAQQLIQMSPVDTGRFRNNWYLSVGYSPVSTTNVGLDPGGGGAVNRIAGGLGAIKAGDQIWITNNLPYATVLEYGSSKQAPSGMVRVSAARFQDFLSKAVGGIGV